MSAINYFPGLSDTPLTGTDTNEDLLNLINYHSGLSSFIENCNTPLTIAVQGSWGSGKTSTMKFVMQELQLNQNIHCLEFNTWQYSQFDMGDSLVFNLLQDLAEKIAPDETKISKFGRKLKKVFLSIASNAAYFAANRYNLDSQLQATVSIIQDAYEGDSRVPTLATQLKELREAFQSDVREFLGKKSNVDPDNLSEKHRLVIFIDDLDRVEATRAIQLLEAFKLFLEIKHCVFVLAIDYDVVAQGVSKKFGFEEDSFKTRQYFDKIIQVPFRMPDVAYKIEGILDPYFKKIGLKNKKYQGQYVSFAKNSIGTNPRSLKRTLNSFALLKTIKTITSITEDKLNSIHSTEFDDLITFVFLCMQSAYPYYYSEFLRNLDNLDRINELLPADTESEDEMIEDEWKIPIFSRKPFNTFRSDFYELLISESEDGEISTDALKNSLGFTSLTAISSSSDKPENIINEISDIYLSIDDRIKQVESHNVDQNVIRTLEKLDKNIEDYNLSQKGDPICIIQLKGQRWNIYHGRDQNTILDTSIRMRPKIAEIHYGKSELGIFFGNSNSKRNLIDGLDHVSPKWREAESRIKNLLSDNQKIRIERRTSGYALAIRGINDPSDVDTLMKLILVILEEYLKNS